MTQKLNPAQLARMAVARRRLRDNPELANHPVHASVNRANCPASDSDSYPQAVDLADTTCRACLQENPDDVLAPHGGSVVDLNDVDVVDASEDPRADDEPPMRIPFNSDA